MKKWFYKRDYCIITEFKPALTLEVSLLIDFIDERVLFITFKINISAP